MTPQETFVTQLRRYRQKNRISLDEIAAEARVKRELLEALENNDLSEWPRGLYARALIRTYSTFVGQDPLDTVNEFCRLFPQGDRRAQATLQELAAIVAAPSGYRDEFPYPEDRRRSGKDPEDLAPKLAWWQMPLSALWVKIAAVAAPHLRARRSARPST
jgi:transcriptional regulator with XRE-family HTH domain